MSCGTILDQLIKNDKLSEVLTSGSNAKEEIKSFKKILFELGFDEVLNPQTKAIEGTFDKATIATIKSFCEKNDLPGDGKTVTIPIAKTMIQRYSSLPDLIQLKHDLDSGNIANKYFKGSTDTQAIASLQKLLHDLGFKKELEWDKYKNNGVFNDATSSAINAFITKQEEKIKDKIPVPKLKETKGLISGCGNILSHFLKKKRIGEILQKGNVPHTAVKEVQTILHKLGFGKELGKAVDKLDGVFSSSTVNAIKSFAQKNNIKTDGTKITASIASALQDKLDNLPFLHQLQRDLREGKTEQKYIEGSKDKIAISSLQAMFNKLGYGKQLEWDKKGNDGIFDKNLSKVIKQYKKDKGLLSGNPVFSRIKHFFSSDEDGKVTPNLLQNVISDASKQYGPDWTDHVKKLQGSSDSILTRFTASNFLGKQITTNSNFVPALQKINAYAVKNNVKVKITNSYRRGTDVPGAIVKPAAMSNHKVGHAIDMNLVFNNGQNANSHYMNPSNRNNWAAPVRGFLDDISNDPALRWGGDFHTVDPVHIDDNLNHTNPDEWHKLRELTIKAYDNHDIKDWTPE